MSVLANPADLDGEAPRQEAGSLKINEDQPPASQGISSGYLHWNNSGLTAMHPIRIVVLHA